MADESIEGVANKYEQWYTTLEMQVTDITLNMSILMADMERKSKPFGDVGGCNSKIGSKGKS